MQKHPTRKLANDVLMPTLGLGVYQTKKGEETQQAVRWALEAGYRHIDTAAFYGNERDVGIAIKTSGIPRDEIFVTTKLWVSGFLNPETAFEKSMDELGLEYIDLYLIHWPFPGKARAWKKLEEIYGMGKVRAIGVSNYSIKHLEALKKEAAIQPMVNQVEFSPFLYQQALLTYCESQNIALEAYSPLTRGKRLDTPLIGELAKKYGKTNAQIMIRWSLQHGLIVIPKSSKKERIKENADVFNFELSTEDMKKMDGLNAGYSALF